jgi:RNA polymerase sigma factor (sigma-70 family)
VSGPTLPPFQAFLEEHRVAVLAFLRAIVGPSDADDCFQETFLAALRAYPRADGRNPRAWILTIAGRKAIDHQRTRSRRPQPVADPPEPRDRPPDAYDRIDERDIWAVVAELPPKQRAAVALRFAADLPYREIGATLDCSEDAARRSVHEGLKTLRRRSG